MRWSPRTLIATTLLFAVATPAVAQQRSEGYEFLQAIKDEDGDAATKLLNRPGSTVINTRDVSSGETALHVVVRKPSGDRETYLRFLLGQRGVDPNIADAKGETPLIAAVNLGEIGLAEILLGNTQTDPNRGNRYGETPLVLAVHRRDIAMTRLLLSKKADPDRRDRLKGMSARDYAKEDTRAPAILKLIEANPAKTDNSAVQGPRL